MPILPESHQALDDAVNRLATESILAQSGRDDGLVPAYSLLGDLRELCSTDETLRAPVVATQTALEKLLDTAQPFDEATLLKLRSLVEWLPSAIERTKGGQVPIAFGTA
ncbi:MAG: chemotaxis protein CheA, partial [Opitutaceae bacterium]